jgi:hypothetical protein
MRLNSLWLLVGNIAALNCCEIAGAQTFNRVATLPNYVNNGDSSAATVSEIIAASADGNIIVYTDSELGEVGFFNIANLDFPIYGGKFGVGGTPTSVAVLGDYALVGVDTSDSFVAPSGRPLGLRRDTEQVDPFLLHAGTGAARSLVGRPLRNRARERRFRGD